MSTDSTRRIVLLRHAKSDHPVGMGDHERPLAERGRSDAPAAGRWLVESGIVPDLCLCSTATRTRETWKLAARELPKHPTTVYEDRIYDASHRALITLLQETADDVETLVVVGHNPGMHYLAFGLAADQADGDRDGDGDRIAFPREDFPTSAIAVITFTGPWSSVADGVGRLERFWTPR